VAKSPPKATPRKPAHSEPEHPPHISQEEAVAHIQALLDAKRERVRQGPTWPTDQSSNTGYTPGEDNHAAPAASPEATYNQNAHERGDQEKRKD
jgi:hypothetical protein